MEETGNSEVEYWPYFYRVYTNGGIEDVDANRINIGLSGSLELYGGPYLLVAYPIGMWDKAMLVKLEDK